MAHFKKYWEVSLQKDVIELVQKKVCYLSIIQSVKQDFLQFSECYKSLNNSSSSATASGKPSNKMTRIGRLVAHELDTDSEAEEDTNLDPSKPWMAKFDRYINTHESIPDDLSTVAWWGVCNLFYCF